MTIAKLKPLPFERCTVLVVEDEYLIADDLAALLRESGAEVLGPAYSLPMATRLASETERIDGAVLDIDLRGVTVFPLADNLRERGVPILFLTGGGDFGIPDQYSTTARCDKPFGPSHIVEHLKQLLRPIPA
jgi:CheY-like chemotaxis protein